MVRWHTLWFLLALSFYDFLGSVCDFAPWQGRSLRYMQGRDKFSVDTWVRSILLPDLSVVPDADVDAALIKAQIHPLFGQRNRATHGNILITIDAILTSRRLPPCHRIRRAP